MRLGQRVLMWVLPALVGVGCGTLGSSPEERHVSLADPIAIGGAYEPVRVGWEDIGRITEGRNALVELRDGRKRDVVDLLARPDSVSYTVMPGDWFERMPRHQIASVSFKRTNRFKGAFHGGRLGFLLAALVGPAAEYWAGARGRTLMWAVPVYGAIGIVLGAPVGAMAGVPELYRYTGRPLRPDLFVAGEREGSEAKRPGYR